jgi:CheY-like chemotaxis protein
MPATLRRTPLNCLVAEDEQADFVLTRRVVEQADVPCELSWVRDGLALLDALEAAASLPDLILLDLNMAPLDGRGALARLQDHPRWRAIPVIVLTTSSDQDDVRTCYAAGANCYVVKHASYVRFREDMACLLTFWGQVADLPTACAPQE